MASWSCWIRSRISGHHRSDHNVTEVPIRMAGCGVDSRSAGMSGTGSGHLSPACFTCTHICLSQPCSDYQINYLQMILPCFAEAVCRLKQIKMTNIRSLIVPLKLIHAYLQYGAFCKENNIQTKRLEKKKIRFLSRRYLPNPTTFCKQT